MPIAFGKIKCFFSMVYHARGIWKEKEERYGLGMEGYAEQAFEMDGKRQ